MTQFFSEDEISGLRRFILREQSSCPLNVTQRIRDMQVELERLTAENAELKHQIEVEAMQNSERINDLQSENAELKEKLKYRQSIEDEP